MKIKFISIIKSIPLPSKHSTGYLKFFVILIVIFLTYPAVPDMTTQILYVLIDNGEIPSEEFHYEVGLVIEYFIIAWLVIWSIKKSIEIYNDITRLVMYLTFRKATSLYNPQNKSPIHLKKLNKKTS
jgi:hypothetical protein